MDLFRLKQNGRAFRFYAVIITVMLLMMFIGYRLALMNTEQSIKAYQIKTGTIAHAQAENIRLVQELSQLQIQLEMSKSVQQLIQQDITDARSENKTLQQKIDLYQAVLGESNNTGPFAIHHAHIMALPTPNQYVLDILLLQGRALKALINGDLTIKLTGMQNDKATSLSLAQLLTDSDIIPNSDTSMRYRYQYFLERQYVFALPKGFTPETMVVSTEVFQWKRKLNNFTQTFVWEDLITPNT